MFAVTVNLVCSPAAADASQHSNYGWEVGTGLCVILGTGFVMLGILNYFFERRS